MRNMKKTLTHLFVTAVIFAGSAAFAWSYRSTPSATSKHPNISFTLISSPKEVGFVNNHLALSIYMPETSLDEKGRFLTTPSLLVDTMKDTMHPSKVGRFLIQVDKQKPIQVQAEPTAVKTLWKIPKSMSLIAKLKTASTLTISFDSLINRVTQYTFSAEGLAVRYEQAKADLKR